MTVVDLAQRRSSDARPRGRRLARERAREQGSSYGSGAPWRGRAPEARPARGHARRRHALPCGLVVVGAGAIPNTELAHGQLDLADDGGIATEPRGRTRSLACTPAGTSRAPGRRRGGPLRLSTGAPPRARHGPLRARSPARRPPRRAAVLLVGSVRWPPSGGGPPVGLARGRAGGGPRRPTWRATSTSEAGSSAAVRSTDRRRSPASAARAARRLRPRRRPPAGVFPHPRAGRRGCGWHPARRIMDVLAYGTE